MVKPQQKNLVLVLLAMALFGCAQLWKPVANNTPVSSAYTGGKTEAMKFNLSTSLADINQNNGKLSSIVRVARLNPSATAIILYPPKNGKPLADKIYLTLQKSLINVQKPLQAGVVANQVADQNNVWVYLTFTPILQGTESGQK